MKIQFDEMKLTPVNVNMIGYASVLDHRIKETKGQNMLHDVYMETLGQRNELFNSLVYYKQEISSLMKMSQHLAKQYREQRIKFLEDEITNNLAYLLPEEKFEAKIDFRTIGDRHYADLLVGKEGQWSSPKALNGRFIRQIISFSAMYSVNKLRGSKTLFYDEALSSADPTSLTELKGLINNLTEEGFQIIMIEHKAEIYESVVRKEFHLHKNREEGNAHIIKEMIVDDIEG